MVFRQSRTLRDVIMMICMLDLAHQDVTMALDLAAARVEGLSRHALVRCKASLSRRPSFVMHWSRRRLQRILPTLLLAGWFALPMTAIAGVCAALVSLELDSGAP